MKSTPGKQSGFSLIELMIASVIGLVLLSGVVTIFSSNSASSKLSTGLSRVQDSGRVALDILSYSIRMSGYEGCRDESKNNIQALYSTPTPTVNFPDNAIWGSKTDGSGEWTTNTPHADLVNLPDQIALKPNTDVLYIQHGSGRSVNLLNNMASASDNIVLPRNPDQLITGDLVMIADCDTTNIIRATNVVNSAGSTTIQHTASKNTQSNLTQAFTGTGNPDAVSVRVMRFESKAYFVGDSGRNMPNGDIIWSLFELDTTIENVNNRRPAELIEGIENFQVLYGVQPDEDIRSDIRYVTANNVTDPAQIVSVQLGLLIGTADYSSDSDDDQLYNIAGWTVGPPDNTDVDDQHAGDRRLRAAFNATIQLRNKSANIDI